MSLMEELGDEMKKGEIPTLHVGDSVQVHYLIKEGEKERVQIFAGTVLSLRGRGIARSFIVRRIVQGEGVERVFPLHSPRVMDVKIVRRGKVRQARLFYLRDRVGKQTRVEELVGEKVRRERELVAKARSKKVPEPAPRTEDDSSADPEPETVKV